MAKFTNSVDPEVAVYSQYTVCYRIHSAMRWGFPLSTMIINKLNQPYEIFLLYEFYPF